MTARILKRCPKKIMSHLTCKKISAFKMANISKQNIKTDSERLSSLVNHQKLWHYFQTSMQTLNIFNQACQDNFYIRNLKWSFFTLLYSREVSISIIGRRWLERSLDVLLIIINQFESSKFLHLTSFWDACI